MFFPLKFLHQLRFQVGTPGDVKYLEQRQDCYMMGLGVIFGYEILGTLVELLNPEQCAHSFIEWKLVGDHSDRLTVIVRQ